MKVGWLQFITPVEIKSNRSASESASEILILVGKPGNLEKRKPYRGYVDESGGVVWFRLQWFTFMSARVLRFSLTPSEEGCYLTGEFSLRPAIRIPVGIYLVLCLCAMLWGLFDGFLHHDHLSIDLGGPLLSFLLIFGYTAMLVRINRSRENQMLKGLEYLLTDDASSKVVSDLLSN